MRVAMVLPGLHRVVRGAEVAFEAIAAELASQADTQVTLFGSGPRRSDRPYEFRSVANVPRERFETGWPFVPIFRSEYIYEEFTFVWNLRRVYRAQDFDVTVTCSYPFINWFLRWDQKSPPQVFVTQNGDHPAVETSSEYGWFNCDGLVCTNLDYFERNRDRWFCQVITNGVDPQRFSPASMDQRPQLRAAFNLPPQAPVALMVSALIPSKRIVEGIKAAAQIPDLQLVVCGDGPDRAVVHQAGQDLMPGRFHPKTLAYDQMPDIYRAADVLVHLSLDEPFGNIYLEALATGLPIVAHDREVTRWIVEETAVLVDSRDSAAIVAGLGHALTQHSPSQRAARQELVQRRFTWQAIGQQYHQFLTATIARHQESQR
ncbi:glycosyltransferase family 4 protein [Prochlorothrix hollandica]|uniref:Glycosyl transferase family 1 domain-containing protein n=1 Tax=Prochlorothrix hollandica PCC 9006 = CALU 1027 TaxID=317619 RepID=A0A0M2PRQ6_PROHO|nr:glycosyltransferase family 4 protein [Prochlorothrix hollandica]KKI98834.1 hypothetical protein PROH_13355 [Prochlorothrix hollandica PCC 9006 = CALU 1027]